MIKIFTVISGTGSRIVVVESKKSNEQQQEENLSPNGSGICEWFNSDWFRFRLSLSLSLSLKFIAKSSADVGASAL